VLAGAVTLCGDRQACPPRLIGGELVELVRVRRVFVVGRRGLS
jgi:hypothetical protein